MKIGDNVYVHGYVDEIRKDTVIIRNKGGYFGTVPSEIICGEMPQPQLMGWWIDRKDDVATCSVCGKRWGLYRLVNYCPNCGARLKESEE